MIINNTLWLLLSYKTKIPFVFLFIFAVIYAANTTDVANAKKRQEMQAMLPNINLKACSVTDYGKNEINLSCPRK